MTGTTAGNHTYETVRYLVSHCRKNCRKECCRESLLYGLLLFSGGHTGEASAQLLDWLLKQNARQDQPLIIEDFTRIDTTVFKCPDCGRFFMCGVFLVCGSVSDPSKSYRIELSVHPDEDGGYRLAGSLCDYLSSAGLTPLRSESRKGGPLLLYYRTSESVEDFLNLIGASPAAFEAMNARIYKDYRNNANRLANCDASNIDRAVSAAQKQISAISALESSGKLALMPEQLRITARLRMENPGVSISELAAMHTPPVTKSCCVHRLTKLTAEAEKE